VSHSNKNFVIAYVFLVVLPITSLVGILHHGRNLKAPASVDAVSKDRAAATKGTPSAVDAKANPRSAPVEFHTVTPVTTQKEGVQ
jgi:hypothetical protein